MRARARAVTWPWPRKSGDDVRGRCVALRPPWYSEQLHDCAGQGDADARVSSRSCARLLVLLALLLLASTARGRRARQLPRRAPEVSARRPGRPTTSACGPTRRSRSARPTTTTPFPRSAAGLDDPSEVVRQAVAVALKRLSRAVVARLPAAPRRRRDERVGEAPDQARDRRRRRGRRAPRGAGRRRRGAGRAANAKYYVSVSQDHEQHDARRRRRAADRRRRDHIEARRARRVPARAVGRDERRRQGGPREAKAQGILPRRQRREARLLGRQPARSRQNRGILLPGARPAGRGPRRRRRFPGRGRATRAQRSS